MQGGDIAERVPCQKLTRGPLGTRNLIGKRGDLGSAQVASARERRTALRVRIRGVVPAARAGVRRDAVERVGSGWRVAAGCPVRAMACDHAAYERQGRDRDGAVPLPQDRWTGAAVDHWQELDVTRQQKP